MDEIQLKLQDNGYGAFILEGEGEKVAEMVIGINEKKLTVYHTEVSDKFKGKGIASKLLKTMVNYARAHELKVIPLCDFVLAQFKRHPDDYKDVWNQN